MCFAEFLIGSSEGKEDIFPRAKIGKASARSVRIEDGRLIFDNQNDTSTLAEFVLKNWTETELDEAKHNTFFNLEPGRCLFMSIVAVSRGHKRSRVPIEPTCLKRNICENVSFM